MTTATYILGIVAPILVLAYVVDRLRRRKLRERHALWWLLAAGVALVFGVFPSTLAWLANAIGVAVPANLVFYLSIATLFLVAIQHATELTRLEAHTRALAEKIALLEEQMRDQRGD